MWAGIGSDGRIGTRLVALTRFDSSVPRWRSSWGFWCSSPLAARCQTCLPPLLWSGTETTLPSRDHVEDSDIIAVGEIVKIDPPRWNSPDGEQWRPREEQTLAVLYTTFYVEPTALLKGTPKWGTPIAFRIQNGVVGGDADLSLGDKVVAFGASDGRYGPGAVYQPAGAYWLTNGNNSIWIQEGETGVYRNPGYTKDPAEASLSLEELEARIAAFTSSAGGADTTIAPSSGLADHFRLRRERKRHACQTHGPV